MGAVDVNRPLRVILARLYQVTCCNNILVCPLAIGYEERIPHSFGANCGLQDRLAPIQSYEHGRIIALRQLHLNLWARVGERCDQVSRIGRGLSSDLCNWSGNSTRADKERNSGRDEGMHGELRTERETMLFDVGR